MTCAQATFMVQLKAGQEQKKHLSFAREKAPYPEKV